MQVVCHSAERVDAGIEPHQDVGDDLIQYGPVRCAAKQGFSMIAAKNDVVASAWYM